jgi:hypothetical protein
VFSDLFWRLKRDLLLVWATGNKAVLTTLFIESLPQFSDLRAVSAATTFVFHDKGFPGLYLLSIL